MTLMSWLHEKLARKVTRDRFSEAMHATEEVAGATRELRRRIEPYAERKDPFIAMLADNYERLQESRIHEGPQL